MLWHTAYALLAPSMPTVGWNKGSRTDQLSERGGHEMGRVSGPCQANSVKRSFVQWPPTIALDSLTTPTPRPLTQAILPQKMRLPIGFARYNVRRND